MAIQYIIVNFEQQRTVFVDGEEHGQTNKTLRVGEGLHTIKLGDPQDYAPRWRRPNVTGTNPISPMEVSFERIDS